MDSIYQAIFSSSRTLLEQLGRLLQADQADFGPFWVLLDEHKTVQVGNAQKLAEFISDPAAICRLCAQVDDGSDPTYCQVENAMVAAGQLCTESIHCGYMLLVLPGYTLDTTQANAGIIEMLLGQLNLLVGMIEKNNQLHQERLSRLSEQSPVLSSR
jgi:hypothetical protein